jgi:hypothetical protein
VGKEKREQQYGGDEMMDEVKREGKEEETKDREGEWRTWVAPSYGIVFCLLGKHKNNQYKKKKRTSRWWSSLSHQNRQRKRKTKKTTKRKIGVEKNEEQKEVSRCEKLK